MFVDDRPPEMRSGQEDKSMSNAVLESILQIKDVLLIHCGGQDSPEVCVL